MKNKFSLFYIVCLSLFFTSACTQGTLSPKKPLPFMTSENRQSTTQETTTGQKNTFLRADPRFINWLEKESLYRHAPDLISIVTGTSLAWRAPSSAPQKANILAISPAWFYANPWQIQKETKRTHFGEFLYSKSPQSLKKIGVDALYFSPTASYSLDAQLNISSQNKNTPSVNNTSTQNTENAITSYTLAEPVGSIAEYQRIEAIPMVMGGDMLEPALGIGPDFLLALRAVREYPGLFMMTELPQELWEQFTSPNTNATQTRYNQASQQATRQSYQQTQSAHNTTFSPHILSHSEKEILIQEGIIPQSFARDFLPDAKEQGFALTNPVRGFDSVERRWIYRYAKNPYRPLLNMADPNLSAHKLFTASIIQQIGILHQPLVGISVADLWGQESFYASPEQNSQGQNSQGQNSQGQKLPNKKLQVQNKIAQFASADFASPALFTLQLWNKAIHNYGSWSLVRDAFPMEYIPFLLAENSDFVADTIFMPALEKSFLTGNATALKTAVQNAMDLNIPFSSLWHGSADTYQKEFLVDFFTMPTSMSLASHVAKITNQEAKLIQKTLDMPSALQTEKQVLAKYNNAKKIQFAHIAFPALLPGLNFISGHDIRGTISSPTSLPQYSLTKNKGQNSFGSVNGTGIMLNASLDSQLTDKNSLLSKLKPVYKFRQEHRLGEAKILAVLKTQKEIFGVLMQAPTKKYYLTIINTSGKNIQSKISIPFTQKSFRSAVDSIKPLTIYPVGNSFSLDLRAWEVRCFELK